MIQPLLTQHSLTKALERFRELSKKRKSKIEWVATLYLSIPATAISQIKCPQADLDYSELIKIKQCKELPRIVLYYHSKKYFLLYGQEIIQACLEYNVSEIPSVIISSEPVVWNIDDDGNSIPELRNFQNNPPR